MSIARLPARRFLDALKILDLLIARRDQRVRLTLVGSGALILGYGLNRQTGDLDCILRSGNRTILNMLIEKVSEDLGLPEDWLNFEFEDFSFSKPPQEGSKVLLQGEALEVRIPSLGFLLAVRCSDAGDSGFRPQDLADIAFCIQKLGISNLTEFYDLMDSFGIPDTLTDSESLDFEKFLRTQFQNQLVLQNS